MKKPFVHKKNQLYSETAKLRVLGMLFKFPEREFSLSTLAKESKVAKANIGKILDKLLKKEIINITKLKNLWQIKANQQNLNFIRSKVVYNLNFIYQSGLVDFLNDYFKNPKAIILFGSFRKGEDISGSDIDMAIEQTMTKHYETKRLEELSDFERKANRKVQVHLFDRKRIDLNLFNNIANGIVLSGFLEVKP